MPNDTEAPTSGATQGAEEQTKATLLSIDQLDFVTLIGQHYGKYGSLLTADLAFERYNVPTDKFRKWMGQDKVRAAIKQQGIELDKFEAAITDPDSWNAHALTPVQLAVANVMTDLTNQKSDLKKLQDLKVRPSQWQQWLRDPVFRDYVDSRVNNILQHDGQHIAGLALMDRVKAGDPKAIAFYYEFTGKFVPKTAGGDNYNQINFQQVVSKMIEIIIEECDPEVAQVIGARFKTLMVANNVAADLLESEENEIIVPPTAPSRELTPEVKELMSRTGGNT